MFWPTLNCSDPLQGSRICDLLSGLVDKYSNRNKAPLKVANEFELIHDGTADVRVGVDEIEGVANESQGHIIKPGETWNPKMRVHKYLTFYTSSNVSQSLRMTLYFYM